MTAVICVLCADHQTHTGHLCPRCLGRLRRDMADIAPPRVKMLEVVTR